MCVFVFAIVCNCLVVCLWQECVCALCVFKFEFIFVCNFLYVSVCICVFFYEDFYFSVAYNSNVISLDQLKQLLLLRSISKL